MSFSIRIDVRDRATPVVKAVDRALRPALVNPIIGRSATNTIREHLFGLNSTRPNQLGGRRTQFYAQAARSTQFQVEGDFVIVSINQVGIAQRFFGGIIRPKNSKYLAIPVHPSAHGKRPREFDLELVFGKGGKPIALATKGRASKRGSTRLGEIMFRLVKSVRQQPDPTVLPYSEQIGLRIERDVDSYVDRAIERASGGAS